MIEQGSGPTPFSWHPLLHRESLLRRDELREPDPEREVPSLTLGVKKPRVHLARSRTDAYLNGIEAQGACAELPRRSRAPPGS